MMKAKRALAGILACAMIGTALAGCGGGGGSSTGAASSGGAGDAASASTAQPVDNTFVQNEDGSFVSGGIQFPLEEPVTYTFFTTPDASTLDLTGGDLNNNTFWQEFSRLTNVHFEFITPAIGTEQEQYNLTITSGELPDMMSDPSYYTDGLDAAIDDGYFMDLTDLIPTYMPDYLNVLQESGWEKNLITDQGRMASVASIFTHMQAPISGVVARKDWLDALNMEVPTTYDEFEQMLIAFRDEYGCESPFTFTKTGYSALGVGMGYINGVTPAMCYQIDGTVYDTYLANPDGAREFLTMLNRWYEEGLIDQNFMSSVGFLPDVSLMNSETCGATFTMYSTIDTGLLPVQQAGGELVGIPYPVKAEGDELHYAAGSFINYVSPGVTISADCENVEILLAALNYLFTEPGFMLSNYGIEGQDYTLDADGTVVFSEEMTANIADGLRLHTMPPSWAPVWVEPDRQNSTISQNALDAQASWNADSTDYMMPSVSLTAEEAAEYADINADLSTYREENELQFITGAKDIASDDEWNKFISTYTDLGAPRCVELYQQALDRYNAR